MSEELPTAEQLAQVLTGLMEMLVKLGASFEDIDLSDPSVTPEVLLASIEARGDLPELAFQVNDALRTLGQGPIEWPIRLV